MINSHQFQQLAKQFRAGRITLKQLTDQVFAKSPDEKSHAGESNQRDGERGSNRSVPGQGLSDAARLPPRAAISHKGDFGRVMVIGGSVGMAGAIGMTGLAAMRSGSGLVKVAVSEAIRAEVGSISPCLMTCGIPSEGAGLPGASADELIQMASWAKVVAIGPGMGRGEDVQQIVTKFYSMSNLPLVIDADGLNALADTRTDLSQHEGPRVLTPHPGEFQRLAGTEATDRHALEKLARKMAGASGVVLVLKGAQTFVTDGAREYRNDTGNPGMATAGSGDVLTGVIASLIGQGMSPFDASAWGVQIHGQAGDFAAESQGEVSMIATDIILHLPGAFKKHVAQRGVAIGFQNG